MPNIQNDSWFVAYTKAAKEKLAHENLLKQSFQVQLPLYKSVKEKRGKWIETIEPMFPRYIFFRSESIEQSIRPARFTLGVQKLITFGDEPAQISNINLATILSLSHQQLASKSEDIFPLIIGNRVEIANGALKGVEGIVSKVAKERVLVLIEILGGKKEVFLQLENLKLIK